MPLEILSLRSHWKVKSNINSQIIISRIDSLEKTQFIFNPNDSPITCGRSRKCIIYINNQLISRIQCVLEFRYNEWILWDGDTRNESKNGTWTLAKDEVKVLSDSVFSFYNFLINFTFPN